MGAGGIASPYQWMEEGIPGMGQKQIGWKSGGGKKKKKRNKEIENGCFVFILRC